METELFNGVRKSGAVTNLAAAGAANAVAVFTPATAFAAQIGTKTFRPRKVMVRNNGGGDDWLHLGTGVGGAFADAFPAIRVLDDLDNTWHEYDLPKVDFLATMTAYPEALGGGGTLDVQVEVEENG